MLVFIRINFTQVIHIINQCCEIEKKIKIPLPYQLPSEKNSKIPLPYLGRGKVEVVYLKIPREGSIHFTTLV